MNNLSIIERMMSQEILETFYDMHVLVAIAGVLFLALVIIVAGKRSRGTMSQEERVRITRAWKEAVKHMQYADMLHEQVKKVTKHAFTNDALSQKEREALKDSWGAVNAGLSSGNESHWRNAVIRADAVLDMALRARKFPGKTMAERMARAAKKYPSVEEAFAAHRLRNELAHNPLRKVSEKETRWALGIFERALRALGVW